MKLVDILARELKVWPDNVFAITQDEGGALNGSTAEDPPFLKNTAWGSGAFYLDCPVNAADLFFLAESEDWAEAIITRTQWQAAVDALKAKKDGTMIIGRFEPFDSHQKAFDVASLEPSRFMDRPGYAGTKADGPAFHVFTEHWKWIPAWTGEGLPPVGTDCELWYAAQDWGPCHVMAHDLSGEIPVAVVRHGEHCYAAASSKILRPIRTPEQIAEEKRQKAVAEMLADAKCTGNPWVERFGALYDAGYRKFEIVDN